MTELVKYESADGIATITLQNGKVNALSTPVFQELNAAFDKAEEKNEIVILTSNLGMLSAGFDLKEMQSGGPEGIQALVATGSRFTIRMLNFPLPIIVAVPGHAVAKGAFLSMCADHAIGIEGDFKIGLNETAIGMAMHHVGIGLAKACLSSRFMHRSVFNAEMFTPETAVQAGFLDQVVHADALKDTIQRVAKHFKGIDLKAFGMTKQRARKNMIAELEAALEKDLSEPIHFGGM